MRKSYLDNAKGIGIIMMIFGHTMTISNPLHQWIYSFHMPLFFVIGGILIGLKRGYKAKADDNLWFQIKRRLISTGIPYFLWGTLLVLFYSILEIVAKDPVTFFQSIWSLLTLKGIESLWFLPPYVIGVIIMLLTKYLGKWKQLIFSLICFGLIYAKSLGLNILIGEVTFKILLGICFIEIGILIVRLNLIHRINLFNIFVLIMVGIGLNLVNGPVEMAVNHIGYPIIYIVGAASTSLAIISLCYKKDALIDRVFPYLKIYGQYSMVILCTNNLIIEIIRLFDYKLTGNILIQLGFTGWILFTVIILVIEWFVIKLAKGKLGITFGYLTPKKE